MTYNAYTHHEYKKKRNWRCGVVRAVSICYEPFTFCGYKLVTNFSGGYIFFIVLSVVYTFVRGIWFYLYHNDNIMWSNRLQLALKYDFFKRKNNNSYLHQACYNFLKYISKIRLHYMELRIKYMCLRCRRW